jgi:hypothetical protein
MGGYAIDAAKSVYAQALAVGMKNFTIGITPMVGSISYVSFDTLFTF